MNLIGLIKSKTREKILRFFFANKEKKYYLRELERVLKLSVGNIRRELISLKKSGLFEQEKIGNLVYYSLNKTSPFLGVIENILSITTNKKTKKNIKKELKKNKDIMKVIKKEDLNLLYSKINELESLLESVSKKKSEVEDFLNLGVVINERGEVLLIRRVEREKGVGKSVLAWAFPGGKQRLNENRGECVARSILTETGYKVKPVIEISLRSHPQFPVFIVYHLCRLISLKPITEPKEPYEVAEVKWVKPKEIKKLFTTDLDLKVSHELGLS